MLYNCANPADYTQWEARWPPLAASFLAAAERTGAVYAITGNLYPYGPVDGPLTEDLPDAAAYPVLADAWDAVVRRCGPNLLTRVDCPVTIANGRWDQMRVHAGRFAAAAPRARVVVVEGASHLFPLTHRAATVEVLREALHEAAPRS